MSYKYLQVPGQGSSGCGGDAVLVVAVVSTGSALARRWLHRGSTETTSDLSGSSVEA